MTAPKLAPVTSLTPHSTALLERRTQALLGNAPTLTFVADPSDPGSALSATLVQSGNAWFGLVPDQAAFTDRVRMGMTPRFSLHGDAGIPTVAGEAQVRVLGRPAVVAAGIRDALLARDVFGSGDAVVIEVLPRVLHIDAEDDGQGAVPRT